MSHRQLLYKVFCHISAISCILATVKTGEKQIFRYFSAILLGFSIILSTTALAGNGAKIPLEKMVGQLIVAGFAGSKPTDSGVVKIHKALASGHAGGVILFDNNIKSPKQLQKLTRYLAGASPFWPVLIATDEEGGIVERLGRKNGFHRDPGASYVARTRKAEKALATYTIMATELAKNGINLNLAPVADLRLNRYNRVIGRTGRTFGRSPDQVIPYITAFIQAHKNAGIITVLKHFPGHGSSRKDSHTGLPDISKSWRKFELDPYRAMINNNMADMIMTGHLYMKSWGLPASLSKTAVTGLLKQQLGFKGPVITDDLQMRAISRKYTLKQAAIMAINAGNDLILVGNTLSRQKASLELLHSAIIDAVNTGKIPLWRIRNAYNRIIALKWRLLDQKH